MLLRLNLACRVAGNCCACPTPAALAPPGTAAPGRHLYAVLSSAALCLLWLGRAGQYSGQGVSQRRALAPAPVSGVPAVLSGDPGVALAGQAGSTRGADVGSDSDGRRTRDSGRGPRLCGRRVWKKMG